jgi:hypothetical protein
MSSHALLTAQFWELMADARLVTSMTPLSKVGEALAKARRPPDALLELRKEVRTHSVLYGCSCLLR